MPPAAYVVTETRPELKKLKEPHFPMPIALGIHVYSNDLSKLSIVH